MVNVLLRLMVEFPDSLLVQRNALGCLFMLTREHALGEERGHAEEQIVEDFRARLGLPLLFKTMQPFLRSAEYCCQLIPLLQNLGRSGAGAGSEA